MRSFNARGLGILTASGGLSALLSACGGNDEEAAATTAAAENAVRGGRAVFATVDKPVNMDPADMLYSSMQVYQNIFHKLVNVDADFKFIPGLASKWTQDDDKTWTLDLVDNAVFHNGEPFTADDVKFSFERLPEHANGIFVNAWKETEVLDPHRVRFHLSQPYGAVLATLAAIGDMVNEKAVTAADPKLKPVGTGPYQMTEWIKDDHITLERWDKFFKPDKPYLDEVVFRAIGDESVRLTGLQTGELDWIQRVPAQRVGKLECERHLLVARQAVSARHGHVQLLEAAVQRSEGAAGGCLADRSRRDRQPRLVRYGGGGDGGGLAPEPVALRREPVRRRPRPRQGEGAAEGGGSGEPSRSRSPDSRRSRPKCAPERCSGRSWQRAASTCASRTTSRRSGSSSSRRRSTI